MINIVHTTPIPTDEALLLQKALQEKGIQISVEAFDSHKHVDLKISPAKLDIEIDGIQHLTSSRQIIADLNRSYHSHNDGFATMHIPNEMIRLHLKDISQALAEASKIRESKIKKINIHLN